MADLDEKVLVESSDQGHFLITHGYQFTMVDIPLNFPTSYADSTEDHSEDSMYAPDNFASLTANLIGVLMVQRMQSAGSSYGLNVASDADLTSGEEDFLRNLMNDYNKGGSELAGRLTSYLDIFNEERVNH